MSANNYLYSINISGFLPAEVKTSRFFDIKYWAETEKLSQNIFTGNAREYIVFNERWKLRRYIITPSPIAASPPRKAITIIIANRKYRLYTANKQVSGRCAAKALMLSHAGYLEYGCCLKYLIHGMEAMEYKINHDVTHRWHPWLCLLRRPPLAMNLCRLCRGQASVFDSVVINNAAIMSITN